MISPKGEYMVLFSLNHNLQGAVTRQALVVNQNTLQQTIARLSSGKKYNVTSDGPASFSILNTLSSDLGASEQGVINAHNGTSLLDTADAGIANIERIFTDIAVLAEDAANGVWTNEQRMVFHSQAQQLLNVADSISQSTNFVGESILDGTARELTLQVGITNENFDLITLQMPNMRTARITQGLTTPAGPPINLETQESSLASVDNVQRVLRGIREERARIGSKQNAIASAISNRDSMNEETKSTISVIGDTDIAQEMENYSNATARSQASTYMFGLAMRNPDRLAQLIQAI